MLPHPPIFLAYGESSGWDVVIWLVVGLIGVITQLNAAKKKRAQPARLPPAHRPPAAGGAGPGAAPTPDELTEIFKRLGASIPATPPPSPPAQPPAQPPSAPRPVPGQARAAAILPRRVTHVTLRKPPVKANPETARRLARVPQKAGQAAPDAAPEPQTASLPLEQGVESQRSDSRATSSATRHSQVILPRIHAMDLRLAPWPLLPMPGLDRTHHAAAPYRARLHTRRELREAMVALALLRPPKAFGP